MSENKETVCAVVVTYNRKELLLECLDALLKQTRPINGLYIIDNFSNDGTEYMLLERGFIAELPPANLSEPWEKEFTITNLTDGQPIIVYYVRMHENTGGAGGFYEGVKRGYEKGYDWLWLMDDDGIPNNDCLQLLLLHDSQEIGILCPLIQGNIGYQMFHHKKITFFLCIDKPICKNPHKLPEVIKLDANAFVGPLIKSRYIEKAGFPKKQLFIWGDDTEYTYRIGKIRNILLCKNAVIKHKNAFGKQIKSVESLKREFFLYRNRILFVKEFNCLNVFAYLYWLLDACKRSIIILLKYKKVKASFYPIVGIINGFFKKI
ncbi:MAG: glycosyltransferase [Treponemataceae bacterium]|nr:glycosyltransferase [Treponemataceae bacterium]